MSPLQRLGRGLGCLALGGFIASGTGSIIFGFCDPSKKLCNGHPSVWFYVAFGASIFIVLSGLVHLYICYASTRRILREVYKPDKVANIDQVNEVSPLRSIQPDPQFLNFSTQFHKMLIARDFFAARNLLTSFGNSSDPELRSAWENADKAGVAISGWEKLQNFIKICGTDGKNVAAVGIDLSWHNGYERGAEPAIEISAYDDQYFCPTSTTHESLTRILLKPNYGQEWHGAFLDVESEILITSGLGELHAAIESGNTKYGDNSDSVKLAECWRRLLFEEQVIRALESGVLCQRVIVIIGTHDVGPFIETAWCNVSASG